MKMELDTMRKMLGAHYHESGLHHQKGQQEGGRDEQLPIILKEFHQSHMY